MLGADMPINLSVTNDDLTLKPRIVVVGVGGAGGNAVNNMIQSSLEGVDFLVCNTDSQALSQALADHKIQLGLNITKGLGAGARPDIGRAAAEEAMEDLSQHLEGANMVFITAGMGGGTGTGAAPVIAKAARDQGILTVGVVTKPFHFEGHNRMKTAEAGIDELQQYVDTLIVIPNQNLFRLANEKTTFSDAFKMADDVLYSGVRGVTDLMIMPGLINLDFADIRTVMGEMGKAMMGTGHAEGENRAIQAAESAISNPLLDDVSMKGARGMLINITGGMDMTLFEVDEAANRVREEIDTDANIIFGSTFDEELNGTIRVSVVATGIDADQNQQHTPQQQAHSETPPSFVQKELGPIVQPQRDTDNINIPTAKSASDLIGSQNKPAENGQEVKETDSYIPPKPVETGHDDIDDDYQNEKKSANPFAAAAMDNAGRSAKPKTSLSFNFFQKNNETKKKEADSIATSGKEEYQPEFHGLEEQSTETKDKQEEDILEIPAFLRRQAN